MKVTKNLALALGMGFAAALGAEEAATAAAEAKPAEAAPAPVAKNDSPGSLKAGNALMGEGKYAEAAAYFEGIGEQSAANGRKKREPWRLIGLSTALIHIEKYAEAATAAQGALDINNGLAPAWNNLASAQGNQGMRTEAIETLKKGIEAVKAAGGDTSKMEGNLAELEKAVEDGKPKKVKEAEAKAKAEAEAAAAKEAEAAKAAEAAPAAAK